MGRCMHQTTFRRLCVGWGGVGWGPNRALHFMGHHHCSFLALRFVPEAVKSEQHSSAANESTKLYTVYIYNTSLIIIYNKKSTCIHVLFVKSEHWPQRPCLQNFTKLVFCCQCWLCLWGSCKVFCDLVKRKQKLLAEEIDKWTSAPAKSSLNDSSAYNYILHSENPPERSRQSLKTNEGKAVCL